MSLTTSPTSATSEINAKTPFSDYPSDIEDFATKLEDARIKNHQIPPLTRTNPDLTQDESYEMSLAIRALRYERNGDRVVGRKIGFTNKALWKEYGVDCSNWSYMYDSSVVDLSQQQQHQQNGDAAIAVDISDLSNLEPKIEPEIVFGLKAPVDHHMGDEQILECIDWMAHGFEIVASVYPGWKFTAADTTAAFALHQKLLLGSKTYLPSSTAPTAELAEQLKDFKVSLLRNGELADEGVGSNVLGSPLEALRHLAELLKKDKINLPLGADEMVTTGTLTRALSISDGDRWHTQFEGLDVAPLDVRFEMRQQ